MTIKAKAQSEKDEATRSLRKLLRPGDTVHCILRHVSSSGMTRHIDFYIIRHNQLCFLSGYIGKVLGYRRANNSDGLVVQGCGMDMGFSIVHSLGYALWGDVARSGTGPRATAVRKRLLTSRWGKSYLTQGGQTAPDPAAPGQVWFGAAGYALRSEWI